MYVSTVTLSPQSWVMERTFETSGPRATVTMKCGVTGWSFSGFWSRRPERSCMTPWTDAKGLQLLSDDVLMHTATQILNEKASAAVLWE